jgi:hypothetical protein
MRFGTRNRNMIDADPQRMDSDDGLRRAIARNVKAETATPGVFDAAQVWTLKERRLPGRAFAQHDAPLVVVDTFCTLEQAEEWTGQRWNPAKHSTRKGR